MSVPTRAIRTHLLTAIGRAEEALKALERDADLQSDHLQVAASWARDAGASIGCARALLDPAARMERITAEAARREPPASSPHTRQEEVMDSQTARIGWVVLIHRADGEIEVEGASVHASEDAARGVVGVIGYGDGRGPGGERYTVATVHAQPAEAARPDVAEGA